MSSGSFASTSTDRSTTAMTVAACVSKPVSAPISSAWGKRRSRSWISASGSSPSNTAQTPRSVDATRMDPSEHSPTANRTGNASPPARSSLGVIPNRAFASS